MNERKRMPSLIIDEVLLLVDAYFELQYEQDSNAKKFIAETLSENMRKLPFYPEERLKPEFRSVSGMHMCLANVGYIDPNNPSKFGHGSALQRKVFEFFTDKRDLLHKMANAIVNLSGKSFPLDYSFESSMTGIVLPSYHLLIERNNKNVAAVRREMKANGKAICNVCGINLDDYYTEGERILEIHIDLPLYKNDSKLVVSPCDLVGICPACHKLAHSSPLDYEIKELEKYIR